MDEINIGPSHAHYIDKAGGVGRDWRGFLREGPGKVFRAQPQSNVSHTAGNNLACPMGGQLLQNGPAAVRRRPGTEEGLFKILAGNFLLLPLITRQLHFWLDMAIEERRNNANAAAFRHRPLNC